MRTRRHGKFWMTTALVALVAVAIPAAAAVGTGKIAGKVVDARGRGVVSALCSLDTGASRRTDRRGIFDFAAVPVGKRKLVCAAARHRLGVVQVRVRAGRTTNVRVVLQRIAGPRDDAAQATAKEESRVRRATKAAPISAEPKTRVRRKYKRKRKVYVSYGVGGISAAGAGYGGGGVARGRVGGYGKASRPARSLRARMARPSPRPIAVRPTERREREASREGYDRIAEQSFASPRQKPLSTVSIDVDTAAYSNMRRFITRNRLPPKDAVRIEELLNYFDYNYAGPKGSTPFAVHAEVSTAPWNKAHRLVHIGLQGKRIETADLPPNNLVFLMDVSGSMHSHDKLPLLKAAFSLLVDQLRPQDSVAITVYAGAAGRVLPPTSGSDKGKILDAIGRLRAGGSTAGAQGIRLAYNVARKAFLKHGNNRVILATDGDFNVGLSSDGALTRLIEKERKSGVFLTVLGFGRGNYQDAKMQKLADKGNGHHAYIDSLLEAQKVMVREMGATLLTIAKDVKVQVEFNPAKVKGWRLIGYENRVMAARDFDDDKKDAGELGAGHSVTFLYELIPAGSAEKVKGHKPLRYQKQGATTTAAGKDELLHVKLRYKAPKASRSKLIQRSLVDGHTDLAATSDAFRFSAAVAQLGLLLRASKHRGQASYASVLKLAEGASKRDPHGDRRDFLALARKVALLARTQPRT